MESPTNRIKEVLTEKGIKQTWLAEKLGMVKTEDIHPPKTGISVHFCVLSLMAMQN